MQYFFSGVEAVFARGVREGGEGAQGRAARAGFHELGPVHGHAVLPVGARAFAARDLRRPRLLRRAVEASGSASGAEEIHFGLCQSESAVGTLPDGIRADAVEMPGTGRKPGRAEEVP